jgi:predicted ABC-class ATPase
MLPWERLRDKILTLEGKPYQAYQSLEGAYRFDRFVLFIDHVVAEPPGVPSSARVRVDHAEARFPGPLRASRSGKIALENFVASRWLEATRKVARARGGRPQFGVDVGGQQILERTACRITEDYIELRCSVVLPAEGRKILPKATQTVFFEDLAQLVDGALIYPNLNPGAVQHQVDVAEDAEALRLQLSSRGIVAFLAEGAVLPRESGSDRPQLSRLVPLQAPPELKVSVDLPHRGAVTGLGIPRGVTVILGHPFSGRSTLLQAIAASVYAHVPGDGREFCATVPDAMLVRAEAGRRVEGVNLSAFVTTLPGDDPARCRTEHAGDVVSQAAGIVEALEAGCSLLLIDEDTSAPGLLARDPLWRQLAPESKSPVTPLAEVVRPLYEEHGVSTIVVTSRSTDYVAIADSVVAMDGFRPRVITADARQAAARVGGMPKRSFGGVHHRVPLPDSVVPLRGRRVRGELHGPHSARTVSLGRDSIDLGSVEQLVDPAQARAIAAALIFTADRGLADGMRTVRDILGVIELEVAQHGLEGLVPDGAQGDLAQPRRLELAAALNRLRTLRVKG